MAPCDVLSSFVNIGSACHIPSLYTAFWLGENSPQKFEIYNTLQKKMKGGQIQLHQVAPINI
jgi:hypothetical protein